MKYKIVIWGDQLLFCSLISNFLSQHGFDIVGEYTQLTDVLDHIWKDPPHTIMVDGRRSKQNGVEEILIIKNQYPSQKIILLTASKEANDLFIMLKIKINGYLLKSSHPSQLIQDIIAICQGETRISSELMGTVISFVRSDNNNIHSVDSLTMREKEVLHFIARGKTNKEIASDLSISTNTVKNHVKSVLSKLCFNSRAQAISYWSNLIARQK